MNTKQYHANELLSREYLKFTSLLFVSSQVKRISIWDESSQFSDEPKHTRFNSINLARPMIDIIGI